MKKSILLLSLATLTLGLSSCQTTKKNISLFFYDQSDIFLTQMGESLKGRIKGYDCNTYYANRSQLNQNQQIEEALKHSNLFIMNMVDRLASGAVVEKCQKKNVPIIFYNREPLLKDMIAYDNCYYVGPNPYQQGALQVECASELFGDPKSLNPKYDLNGDGKIQLIILKGEQGHQDAEQRTQACLSTLQQKGYEIQLLNISVCNWNREEAYNMMWSNYSDYGKSAELILANNDEMAIGAASYLKGVTPEDQSIIPIIGVDATTEGIHAVDSGLLSSTVVNDSESQVDAIAKLTEIFLNNTKTMEDFPYPITNSKMIYIGSSIYEKHKQDE